MIGNHKIRMITKFQRVSSLKNIFCRHSSSSILAKNFYNEDQLELQKTAIRLIEKEINPYADEWEKNKSFPAKEVFKKFGQLGLLGINKPIEYSGLGLDYKYQLAFLEAAGYIRSSGVAMGIGVQTDCATPALARFGSDELKKDFLKPALEGDMVGCIGVSEPGGGSDVANIKTKAVKKKGSDDLIINGQKMWITNSLQADWMCLLANTDSSGERKAHNRMSLIMVPMDTKGVIKAKKIEKMGMHSSDTGLIFFEDVHVPSSYIIGEEGLGFTYQMLQFQEERLAAAAGALIPLQVVIDETIQYTKSRMAFGKPLLDNQYMHFRLAELQTELDLVRSMLYMAANAMLEGHNVTLLASMLKLKTGRLAREVTDSCLQFWGGMGFTNEVYVSRLYRDLRLWSIGGGADEVMLGIISKMMGIRPSGN